MAGPVVRVRTDADLPAVAAALVEVHGSDGYPVEGVDDPVGWLAGATLRRAWVAELDGRIVGHVGVSDPRPDDAAAILWREQGAGDATPVAVLGRLFVVTAARRRATGAHLVNAAVQDARREGLRLVLDVMAKDTAAVRLYERLGWRHIGTTEHDDGHGATFAAHCYVSPRRTP